jgi:endonuclease YncB( thermonuclease family)
MKENTMSAYVKGERKKRKQESNQFVVKWIEGDSIFFRWFKRDRYAVQFQQELIDDGIPPENVRIQMK